MLFYEGNGLMIVMDLSWEFKMIIIFEFVIGMKNFD